MLPTLLNQITSRFVLAPLFVLGAAISPLAFESEDSERSLLQRGGLTPVIGHWSQVDDGGPAMLVDGSKWSGKSNADSLGATARRLFGAPAPDFVKNNMGDGSFPIAVHEPTASFANGTLRVRFKLVGGATDQIAGILFGLKPDGSYYYVRYNTRDDNVALWKYVNGAREVIAHGAVHVRLTLGAWHELVVQIDGPKVSGWIAGQDSIRVEHALPAAVTGRVGVWAKRDAVTGFREFGVSAGR